jgi:cysteinyl-tRNA synthetase
MKKTGKSRDQVTGPIEERFVREAGILSIKLPDVIARSSTSVDQAVELIQILVCKGYAYWHGCDVFYDPLKFKGFGKLFGLDMSLWPKKKVRFHKDTYPGQRWNLGDFILWHGCQNNAAADDMCWDTDVGKGRPSWNIQDPAMLVKHLGYEVDISCGGVDNLYRHHDYNIAVLEAASGKTFAPYWLHGQLVLINGRKMSKSKGNTVYLDELLENGFSPEHIRFFLIYKHYRQKLNLMEDYMNETQERLNTFTAKIRALSSNRRATGQPEPYPSPQEKPSVLATVFEQGLNDDLNVAKAFDALEDQVDKLIATQDQGGLWDASNVHKDLIRINNVLQIMPKDIFR